MVALPSPTRRKRTRRTPATPDRVSPTGCPPKVKARAIAKSGTKVVLAEESVRRVVQCRCGASARFRGPEDMWAAGWGSRWVGETRVWQCEACYSPAPPAPSTPSYRVDEAMLEASAAGGEASERLRRQVVRLLEQDPPRGRAYLDAILGHLEKKRGPSADRWRALREVVREAVAGRLLTSGKPARPRVARGPLVKKRRIPSEVATETIAVRMTKGERAIAEDLAKKRGLMGMGGAPSPGLLLRMWVQLAGDGILVQAAPVERPTPPTPEDVLEAAGERAEAALADVLEALRGLPLEAPVLPADPWSKSPPTFTTPAQGRAVALAMELFHNASRLHSVAFLGRPAALSPVAARIAESRAVAAADVRAGFVQASPEPLAPVAPAPARVEASADESVPGRALWLVDQVEQLLLLQQKRSKPVQIPASVALAVRDLRASLGGAAPLRPSLTALLAELVEGQDVPALEALGDQVSRALAAARRAAAPAPERKRSPQVRAGRRSAAPRG